MVRVKKEVRNTDLARRDNAAAWSAAASRLALPALLPTSEWLGDAIYGAIPINTSIRQLSLRAQRDGLHVLELFGGVGPGVLRVALSAQYVLRCYIYVKHDPISRRIVKEVLQRLQRRYPDQLMLSATLALKETTSINRCINNLLLGNLSRVTVQWTYLVAPGNARVSIEPASSKEQSIPAPVTFSTVAIINFLRWEQASPLIYLLGTPTLGSAVPLQ